MRLGWVGTATFILFFPAFISGAQQAAPPPRAAATPSRPDGDAAILRRQAAQRITELQREADRITTQTRSVLGQLRALDLQRQIKEQQVASADAELGTLTRQVTSAEARVAALEQQRQAETPWVRERLVEIYKRGRVGNLRLLLAADDLRKVGRMSRGVAAIARLDRVRIETHRQTVRAERSALAELQKRRVEAEAARVAALDARRALDRAVFAHNRRLDALDEERDLAARYIGELEAAQVELQKAAASVTSTAAALPLAPFRGALDWPAAGRIASRFGPSTVGRFGNAIVRNGIEIDTPEGAPVRAVHGGTVAYAAPFTGFGTLVIVDHGRNTFTMYGHLSQALVTSGARVGRGELVGRSGRAPDGEPATYFELRIDGRPVDPVQWLRSTR